MRYILCNICHPWGLLSLVPVVSLSILGHHLNVKSFLFPKDNFIESFCLKEDFDGLLGIHAVNNILT